jgi:VanZ family protein
MLAASTFSGSIRDRLAKFVGLFLGYFIVYHVKANIVSQIR